MDGGGSGKRDEEQGWEKRRARGEDNGEQGRKRGGNEGSRWGWCGIIGRVLVYKEGVFPYLFSGCMVCGRRELRFLDKGLEKNHHFGELLIQEKQFSYLPVSRYIQV